MEDHVTIKAPHYASTLKATWGAPYVLDSHSPSEVY